MEFLLTGGKKRNPQTNEIIRESPYLQEWQTVPKQKRTCLHRLWNDENLNIRNIRNDLLHSGFRTNSLSATSIIVKIEEIFARLKEIASL